MRYPTLTRNNDFRRAYQRGKSFVGYSLVLYVVKNRTGGTRIGITSSKKIGNAVQRNRARRVIRAAAAQVLPATLGGVDLVFVARTCTAGQKSTQVAAVMRKLLRKAELLPTTFSPSVPAKETAGVAAVQAIPDVASAGEQVSVDEAEPKQ